MALYLGDAKKKVNGVGATSWDIKVKIPVFDFLDNTFPISVKHSEIWDNPTKIVWTDDSDTVTFIKISNLALSCYTMNSLIFTVNALAGTESINYSGGLILGEMNEETNYYAGYFNQGVLIFYILSIPSAGTYLDIEFKKPGIYIGFFNSMTELDGYEVNYTLELPSIFTITSGEGSNIVANNYIVPNIPEYDQEAYPYAIITKMSWNGYMGIYDSYTFMATSTPRYKHYIDVDCLTIIEDQTGISSTIYYDSAGTPLDGWSELKEFTSNFIGDTYNSVSDIIWSNYNIYQLVESDVGIELSNGDIVSISDTIVFAKSSDLVDCDNLTLVKWNGSVVDFTPYDLVTDSSGTFYKATDDVLDKVNFIDGFYITGADVAVKITDEMVVLSDGIIGIDGIVICTTKAGAVYGDKIFPEAGLYMASKDVVNMFAYVKTYPICWDVTDITEDTVYGEGLLGNFIKISDMTPTHGELVGGKVIMHISDGTNVTDLEAVLDLDGSMSNDECDAAQCYAFAGDEETQELTYAYCIVMVSCKAPNTTISYSYQTVTLPEAGLYYWIYDMSESPAENLQISCEFDKGSGEIWSGDIVVNSDSITSDSITHVILNDFDITMLKVSDTIMSVDDIRASSVLFKDRSGMLELLDTIGDSVGTEGGSLVSGTTNERFGWVNELDGCNSYRDSSGGFTKLISVYDTEAAGHHFAYGNSKYDKPFPETGTYVAVLEDVNGETSEWILRTAT